MVQQLRRDTGKKAQEHGHYSFHLKSPLQKMKWQDVISCRTCKYSLVNALGECLMKNGRFLLNEGKVAGCFEDGLHGR